MAKMFYTLDQAAQMLGLDEQAVKEMATRGELQQFRDGTKLMFKREQVDALAKKSSGGSAAGDSGPIPLAGSDDTDAIDLGNDDSSASTPKQDTREATGISVFDAGEVEHADPAAQTQVTHPVEDQDLALESVGSGSGLLDLTRESDDTSLGAELLDEIYPGGEASDAKLGSVAGSTGMFESAVGAEAQSETSGLVNLQATGGAVAPVSYGMDDGVDSAGSGFSAGMLFGAIIALIIGLIVAISAIVGQANGLAQQITNSSQSLLLWCGGLLVLSIVLGLIGLAIGKAAAK